MVLVAHLTWSRPSMQQVDFFELTRGVQDRLLSSCRGEFDPKPILFQRATRHTGLVWLMLTPLSVVGMWWLFTNGLGDMGSPMGRHPQLYVGAYVALTVAFAVGIVQWAALRARTATLPFVPGYYLFPACLIDARGTKLGVVPMTELTQATIERGKVVARFGSRTYRFAVDGAYRAQAISAIKLAQMQCSDPLEDAARVLLDPLAPPMVEGPFAPEKALLLRRPLWVKIRLIAAFAFGVVGLVIFQKRDRLSDEAMFAVAEKANDVATYQLYLAHGTAHQLTVSRLLLPRAELRLAVAQGTVEAIDAFKAAYPDTDIGEEVEAARKTAVEAAFAKANQPGTFDALMAFEATYPGHHLNKQVAAAKHAIYARALADYKRAKMPKAGKTATFAGELVAFAEKTGPLETPAGVRGAFVEVRLRPVPSKALEKADQLVEKNPYFIGPRSRPTGYLAPEKLQAIEDRAAAAYVDALSKGFPASVLRFRAGEDMDGSVDLPAVDKPTLVVSYRIEPSGANYASAKPRGIYIGLVYFFRVDFLLPAKGEPHGIKHVLALDVPGKLVREHAKKPEGILEQKLYDAMSNDAFDDLFKRYIAEWLRPELLTEK